MSTYSPPNYFYIGGNRTLKGNKDAHRLIGKVTREIIGRLGNNAISTGCAVGADAIAILYTPAHQLRIHTAGTSYGKGYPRRHNLHNILDAEQYGAEVHYMQEQDLKIPMRARLMQRSINGFQDASQALFFLASPRMSGSLKVASRAATAGLSVTAFCFFHGSPASLSQPKRRLPGRWVRASNFWARFRHPHKHSPLIIWHWESDQDTLF